MWALGPGGTWWDLVGSLILYHLLQGPRSYLGWCGGPPLLLYTDSSPTLKYFHCTRDICYVSPKLSTYNPSPSRCTLVKARRRSVGEDICISLNKALYKDNPASSVSLVCTTLGVPVDSIAGVPLFSGPPATAQGDQRLYVQCHRRHLLCLLSFGPTSYSCLRER